MGKKSNPPTYIIGKLTDVRRSINSVNGNPRFHIEVDGKYHYFTAVDASVNYEVTNFRLGTLILFSLDGRERIYDMKVWTNDIKEAY